VLERLARDRVVSSAEIARYASEIPEEIAKLEARLYRLKGSASDGAGSSAASAGRRKARRTSSAGLDAKRLGGRFAGLIRRLPEKDRKQYHEIKRMKGVEAAIRALQNRKRD
jgi:hypothetical protein